MERSARKNRGETQEKREDVSFSISVTVSVCQAEAVEIDQFEPFRKASEGMRESYLEAIEVL
jgi:hypothetical protein